MSEALTYLGAGGRSQCTNFTPLGIETVPSIPARKFRVRLHFAEPDELAVGDRVFDVALQGKSALKDFDVVAAAGGWRKSVVREFPEVEATDTLTLEFKSSKGEPILSAWEVFEEPVAKP